MNMGIIHLKVYVLAIVAVVLIREGEGRVEPLNYFPQELQKYLDICRGSGDLSQQTGRLVFWTAINQYSARFVQQRPNMTPQQISYFSDNLRDALSPILMPGGRKKRQAGGRNGRRIRREIRTLSVGERRSYFRALNVLKRDTRLPPNVYDFLADFHAGTNIQRAHFGPAFPSWHRLYLWILEFFLRGVNPTVTIPYWASVLDNDMENPSDSVLFSPAFYGNGVGEVVTGPFRTWAQVNPATRITRNVQDGQLYTYDGIQRILSRRRNRDILVPTALADSNFETQHGAAHVFVGGNMNDLNSAARDPIFFSHHGFVDQIWQRFKTNQENSGIDPQSDYPFDEGDPRFSELQRPTANAGFDNLAGANQWTIGLGNLNVFSDFVLYDDVPSCPRCGNSQFLRCNNQLTPPRCVSRSRTEMQGSGLLGEINLTGRKKRQAATSSDNYLSCPRRSFLNDVDTRQLGYTPLSVSQNQNSWAYIPFKLVTKRPPEFTKFDKYSLDSARTANAHLGLKSTFVAAPAQKKYSKCEKMQGSVGRIKVVGYGLNYKGYAEEDVIVDNRLGVSESLGYLPVRIPKTGEASEVIVAAFDSCGRVCRPYCKQGPSGGMDSQFTGAIRVSVDQPLQYDHSYGDATLHVWDIPNQTSCPRINYDNIPVSFFCEYTDTWIWGSGSSSQPGPFGPNIPSGGRHGSAAMGVKPHPSGGVMSPPLSGMGHAGSIGGPHSGRSSVVFPPVDIRGKHSGRKSSRTGRRGGQRKPGVSHLPTHGGSVLSSHINVPGRPNLYARSRPSPGGHRARYAKIKKRPRSHRLIILKAET